MRINKKYLAYLLAAIFVLVLIIGLKSFLSNKSFLQNNPLPIFQAPTGENSEAGMVQKPEIVKTKEESNIILPGLPPHINLPIDGVIVSSYQGIVKGNSSVTAYGVVSKSPNTTVEKVFEDIEDRGESDNESLAQTWIIDQPEDPKNTGMVTMRAHNNQGTYFWLSILQDGEDVLTKFDFIFNYP